MKNKLILPLLLLLHLSFLGWIGLDKKYLNNEKSRALNYNENYFATYKKHHLDIQMFNEENRYKIFAHQNLLKHNNIFFDETMFEKNIQRYRSNKKTNDFSEFYEYFLFSEREIKKNFHKDKFLIKNFTTYNIDPTLQEIIKPELIEEKVEKISSTKETTKDTMIIEWVRDYTSGSRIPSVDYVSAMTVDDSGNIYVTGSSVNSSGDFDYVIIKYNSSGNLQWMVRYNGLDKLNDYANAIAVDRNGNVYVTGYSYGIRTYRDLVTVKYNSNGVQQWVARYNSPSNGNDIGIDIAIDGIGNVYVTGTSDGTDAISEFTTIKYNPSGTQLWVSRYSGPAKGWDVVTSMALDKYGNVYVTGKIQNSGTGYDFATLKYNTNGFLQWVAIYNGTGNINDHPNSIVVDNFDNVYVTGVSNGINSSGDFTTIKYNSSGVQQWVAIYNGTGNYPDDAYDVAVDNSGNVYVTGISYNPVTYYDIVTIKYNSSGIEQWVRNYSGPRYGWDAPNSIIVDKSGNIFITGYCYVFGVDYDFVTIKYSPDGDQYWIARYNGLDNDADGAVAIAIDSSGNVYVAGDSYGLTSDFDFTVVKYDGILGSEQWVKKYNGPGYSSNYVAEITIDKWGNIYVTGSIFNSSTGYDYITIKYNSSGEQQWIASYNGPGNGPDYARSIEIDDLGNVYVTGYSYSWETYFDYTTIKYNSNGVQLWVARYDGPGHYIDKAYDVAVDHLGNVYVTGMTFSFQTDIDYTTIKYDANGVLQWKEEYNGPINYIDEAIDLTVDLAGNVYVTGGSFVSHMNIDCITIKYKTDGTIEWVSRFHSPANYDDYGLHIVYDTLGYIYLSGFTSDPYYSGDDFFVTKFDTLGNQIWHNQFRFYLTSFDFINDMAIDNSRNIYLTGFYTIMRYHDYLTVKYDSSGKLQWYQTYNGPGNFADEAISIDIDNLDNIYITGSSFGLNTCSDITTIKYNSKGFRRLVLTYNGPADDWDFARGLVTDESGNVYVTGNVAFEDGYRIVVIKYKPIKTLLEEETRDFQNFVLFQNYPNPFNSSTFISYQLPVRCKVNLKIFDLFGKEIANLVNEEQNAGKYQIKWVPNTNISSGVYFYRLEALPLNSELKPFLYTKKIIFLK